MPLFVSDSILASDRFHPQVAAASSSTMILLTSFAASLVYLGFGTLAQVCV